MPRKRHHKPLLLTEDERRTLEQWTRRPTTAQRLALRSRMVLACAEGLTNRAVVNHSEGTDPYLLGEFKLADGTPAKPAFQLLRDRLEDYTPEWAEEITPQLRLPWSPGARGRER